MRGDWLLLSTAQVRALLLLDDDFGDDIESSKVGGPKHALNPGIFRQSVFDAMRFSSATCIRYAIDRDVGDCNVSSSDEPFPVDSRGSVVGLLSL